MKKRPSSAGAHVVQARRAFGKHAPDPDLRHPARKKKKKMAVKRPKTGTKTAKRIVAKIKKDLRVPRSIRDIPIGVDPVHSQIRDSDQLDTGISHRG